MQPIVTDDQNISPISSPNISPIHNSLKRLPSQSLSRSCSSPNKMFIPKEITIQESTEDTSIMSPERRAHIVQLFLNEASTLIHKRRIEMETNGAMASLCARDAFEGRLSNGLATNWGRPPFIFSVYQLQTNHNWMNLVIISSAFHTLLTFLEPGCATDTCVEQSRMGPDYYNMIAPFLYYFHYLVWFIHAFDCGMKVFYQGVREFFNHDWQQLYFIAIAFHFLDLCVSGQTYFTNPLRPVVWLSSVSVFRTFMSICI